MVIRCDGLHICMLEYTIASSGCYEEVMQQLREYRGRAATITATFVTHTMKRDGLIVFGV